ncbi:hypothetical protein B0T26DRAFT_399524 [Lasiosphaeria miniovina]|uniref:Uncharacterized protein n=1 Tax=Lasiosphaeria miniovina TaxID=1954250 RepID=A0AA40A4M0_9PEZI|nr:uncharacterized protein B0T26DRAFT_399524 [Lasiosphaeria miniovina]KAK0709238.1 hypothetical protein B0T26DRAFT_399524 [Lasiosphaeria miniovina]
MSNGFMWLHETLTQHEQPLQVEQEQVLQSQLAAMVMERCLVGWKRVSYLEWCCNCCVLRRQELGAPFKKSCRGRSSMAFLYLSSSFPSPHPNRPTTCFRKQSRTNRSLNCPGCGCCTGCSNRPKRAQRGCGSGGMVSLERHPDDRKASPEINAGHGASWRGASPLGWVPRQLPRLDTADGSLLGLGLGPRTRPISLPLLLTIPFNTVRFFEIRIIIQFKPASCSLACLKCSESESLGTWPLRFFSLTRGVGCPRHRRQAPKRHEQPSPW